MTQFTIQPLDPSTTDGVELAAALENQEDAQLTQHAGSARPSYAQAGMLWLDTTAATSWIWKLYTGSLDIPVYRFNSSTGLLQQRASEIDVASAATTNILAAAGDVIRITGAVTITSFGTEPRQIKYVRMAGALVLTHNATTLVLPNNGANITTEAGDTFIVISDASGNSRVYGYQRADGEALNVAVTPAFASGTSMIFFDAAAPTGWTKDTTHHDKAIRVVNTSGGAAAGSLNFSTVFGITATGGTSLTQAHLPSVTLNSNTTGSHTHGLNSATDVVRDTGSSMARGTGSNSLSKDDLSMDSAGSHSHTVSLGGSDTAHTHPIDLQVRYCDVIICNKD
jgi:hypothetical protein